MVYIKSKKLSSFRPDKVCKKLYIIAKACKRYYSPTTFRYYVFLISYLRFYVKGGFERSQGFKKEFDTSLPSNEKGNKYTSFQIMQNNMNAPLLCLDFDGVIHSFKSGWKGATNIPDPPVEGAIDWLRSLLGRPINEDTGLRYIDFRLAIYSARSRLPFW